MIKSKAAVEPKMPERIGLKRKFWVYVHGVLPQLKKDSILQKQILVAMRLDIIQMTKSERKSQSKSQS